jgi:hypothetical protein
MKPIIDIEVVLPLETSDEDITAIAKTIGVQYQIDRVQYAYVRFFNVHYGLVASIYRAFDVLSTYSEPICSLSGNDIAHHLGIDYSKDVQGILTDNLVQSIASDMWNSVFAEAYQLTLEDLLNNKYKPIKERLQDV